MRTKPVKFFCSYSHKDEELKNSLETHLSILKRQGIALIWQDRTILAGQEWESEINEHLDNADIVILLLSADFIASDYCYGKELKRALARHRNGKTEVLPIIARPVDWTEAPFAKLQALPRDGKPVTSWQNQDEAWLDVTKGIRKVIQKINSINDSNEHNGAIFDIDTTHQRRFIHTKMISKGLLELENYPNPYLGLIDPTDAHEFNPSSEVYAFAWLPTTQYLQTSQLQQLTPVAAICTLQPNNIIKNIRSNLDSALLKQLDKPPSKFRNEEKEQIISAMAMSLSDSFLLGVSIPSLVLGIGKTNPKLAYQAITNVFLLPLLLMHKKQGFEYFHIRLSKVGSESAALLSLTKTILKASYPKKNACSADLIDDANDFYMLESMARFIAWAVGAYYNSGNQHWVQMLDDIIHKNNRALSA